MSNLNRITLIGNVGTEPEYVDFESGAKLTKFTLAVGRYDKKNNQDVTDWFNVETFSKLGNYIKKGVKVCVDGSMETYVYQNKDGNNVKKFVVKGRTVEILTPKKDREENTSASSEQVEDLGGNSDYPEGEGEQYENEIPDLIDEDEIPF